MSLFNFEERGSNVRQEMIAGLTTFLAMVYSIFVVPGMLMAAARLNVPSIFISGGAMLAGVYKGKKVGLSNVFEAVGLKSDALGS